MSNIHPSAVICDGAVIGEGTTIGAFCYIGPDVRMGKNNKIHAHAVIDGFTEMGDGNQVYSFACLGKNSQDLKYREDMTTYTKIGNNNTFREYVTVNAASIDGESTIIGDNCHLLSYSHIAHDCVLANGIIISSNAMLAGHVIIDDNAIVNGKTGVAQFVRIGKFAFIGGFNKVNRDILPFCIAEGNPSELRAVNRIGMERHGYDAEAIKAVRDAFRTLIRSGIPLAEAVEIVGKDFPEQKEVAEMVDFALNSKLGLARPKKK
jgi:UDP-N-acetylglucosamine acyltransferase